MQEVRLIDANALKLEMEIAPLYAVDRKKTEEDPGRPE